MKSFLKRMIVFLLLFSVLLPCPHISVSAKESEREPCPFQVDATSAILMDVATGTVLFAQNPDEALPPASVTKVMTLLLVMEAIEEKKIAFKEHFSSRSLHSSKTSMETSSLENACTIF